MRVQGKSKTRESRFNARIGVVVSLCMLLIGLTQFPFVKADFAGKIFFAVWMFINAACLYQAYRNGFTDSGIEHEVTDHDLEIEGGDSRSRSSGDFAKRIRTIEQLRKEGLISAEEYARKRRDVLDEDWGK